MKIKTVALKALVSTKLEQHFAMTRVWLIVYDRVRSEIQVHTETRWSQFAFKSVAAKNTSDALDVDSFGNGDKRSKG